MEPEGSLPHSQVPAICPYPEPARSSPYPPPPTSWRSILILSSHLRPGLPSGLFPSGFPNKTLYTPLLSPMRATCPIHLILLDFINRTILGEKYTPRSSLCNFLHFPVTWSLLRPNILLNTLFSDNFNLRFSLNMSDQVSHPCKTTDKVIILYILIFKFLDNKLEDKRFCTEQYNIDIMFIVWCSGVCVPSYLWLPVEGASSSKHVAVI